MTPNKANIEAMIAKFNMHLSPEAPEKVATIAIRDMFDGISQEDQYKTVVLAARALIEEDPAYDQLTVRLVLAQVFKDIYNPDVIVTAAIQAQVDLFVDTIVQGVQLNLIDKRLLDFDIAYLAEHLRLDVNTNLTYLGLQTLLDRYMIKLDSVPSETPSTMLMRVAMGLALNEDPAYRDAWALKFYKVMSDFDFMPSTPTLFNSGTTRPQLSSCYVSTVEDDLAGIFDAYKQNGLLSKYAGGLGNDWTKVRASGSLIEGTQGKSQGVIPFLKVTNDVAVAVNQCFAPYTMLHTADGVKAISDVKVGDLVLGISGIYREVQNTMSYDQLDEMVAVDVKHSIKPLHVTTGHPFYVLRGVPIEQTSSRTYIWLGKGKIKPEWVDAGQLHRGDYIAQVIPTEIAPVQNFSIADARLYGILLGDGHMTKDGSEWGVTGNPQSGYLQFVQNYLKERNIHYWENPSNETCTQIRWASGRGALRDESNGQYVSSGLTTLPFTYEDLYSTSGEKHISRRFNHLPRQQTLALLQGLLETDGGVSRGKEIYFTSTSLALAEGLRYQCLRLGVPTAGQYRERDNSHTSTRSDGFTITFNGVVKAYDIRVPAVTEIAMLVGCRPIGKHNWITHQGMVFSRIRSVHKIPTTPVVHDLIVEGDESYMTTSGLAHNGGRRRGAVCVFLETWHLDIEEFLDLRKNTGDERRRTHDMNTANWIPDLFMKRVMTNGDWTLFSPNEVPELHELYGDVFEQAYVKREQDARDGKLKQHRTIAATTLWRKMLTMLFETGHPWLTFKDPCNIRSPQQHVGVVHSSNLCTEITLNTSKDEIAVCNLGSVNLHNFIQYADSHIGGPNTAYFDSKRMFDVIQIAMRMLDNVIDINFYSVEEARTANLRNRPVGLGMMGYQDCLYALGIPFDSQDAVTLSDRITEYFSYAAIYASNALAKERVVYPTYAGSTWSQGKLPYDTLEDLATYRGEYLELDRHSEYKAEWDSLRASILQHGMRNSNCTSIAPTATIANIIGVTASIEPTFKNIFTKSNLSGEFLLVNRHLVEALKGEGLWDTSMLQTIKELDGQLDTIPNIPDHIKTLYKTAFDVDPKWVVEAGARRQKWLDQSQSLNIYIRVPSGKAIDAIYKLAWLRGLKSTYYLRSMGATTTEKSTSFTGAHNAVAANFCSIDNPECESCQ